LTAAERLYVIEVDIAQFDTLDFSSATFTWVLYERRTEPPTATA